MDGRHRRTDSGGAGTESGVQADSSVASHAVGGPAKAWFYRRPGRFGRTWSAASAATGGIRRRDRLLRSLRGSAPASPAVRNVGDCRPGCPAAAVRHIVVRHFSCRPLPRTRSLSHLDEIVVGVAEVAADLHAMVLRLGKKLAAACSPLLEDGEDIVDPYVHGTA
jgi:hypothetical protein